jgi:hypothetical protein
MLILLEPLSTPHEGQSMQVLLDGSQQQQQSTKMCV